MASSITINVGGASASGAQVLCIPKLYPGASGTLIGAADASGNVTFSGLTAGSYTVRANASGIPSGAFFNFVYRKSLDVVVDGSTNIIGLVISPPVAANSSNAQ